MDISEFRDYGLLHKINILITLYRRCNGRGPDIIEIGEKVKNDLIEMRCSGSFTDNGITIINRLGLRIEDHADSEHLWIK